MRTSVAIVIGKPVTMDGVFSHVIGVRMPRVCPWLAPYVVLDSMGRSRGTIGATVLAPGVRTI